jgi:uncharacterized protein DUF6883
VQSRETPERRQSADSTGENRRLPAQRRASRSGDWEALAKAFRQAALNGEVIQHLETSHGVKYVLHAAMETPSGKSPLVRTVWIVDRGRNFPRMVTAYPA